MEGLSLGNDINNDLDSESLKVTVLQLVDIVRTLQDDVATLQSQIKKCCCSNRKDLNIHSAETYSDVLKNSCKLSNGVLHQVNPSINIPSSDIAEDTSANHSVCTSQNENKQKKNKRNDVERRRILLDPPESLISSEISVPVLNSCMEWKVRNRSPTATEEKFYSMAFYTAKPGYRIQLRAQIDRLHGDIYFGVFVLPGVFDEYLSWPFNEKFCLKLKTKSHIPEEFYVPPKNCDWQKVIMNHVEGKKVRKYLNETEFVGPYSISQYMNRKDILFIVSLVNEQALD